ncbi:MAG: hypothetical protein K6T88_08545 [Bacillus sp. (in: Bacteria)]|nr:hypothetical protein [Bacillus sp. (in: firmicutes)]
MDKDQLEWQRKVIKEEYVDEQKQIADNVTVRAEQPLYKRKSRRIMQMEAQVGNRLSKHR